MAKISVIVPIYNAAQTLDACMRSLLEQSFLDFEVLLVNDGSTDESGALCGAWQVRDERVRALNKDNGGVQTAVLHGLAQAACEWCAFVDSDDTVKPDFLAALWQGAQTTGADIVCCGFADVNEAGMETVAWERSEAQCCGKEEITAALDSFFEREADLTSFCAAPRWNKLYRTALLREIAPCLDSAQAFGEDTVMNLYALANCSALAVVPYVGYCYTVQPASATRGMSEKKFDQYCHMMALLRQAARELHREGKALQPRQDALFSALILQTLISRLPLAKKRSIICALRKGICDRQALLRFASTQPLHGRLALQSISAGAVFPAVAATDCFREITERRAKK